MRFEKSKILLAAGLVMIPGAACKKASMAPLVEVRRGSADAGAIGDFDESKYTNEQRVMDPVYGENVSGPKSPSTMLMLESSESDARTIDISLSLNVWGVGSDSKTTTNLRIEYTPGLSLTKHTPVGDTAILDAEGEIIQKADNPPVAQCTYDAMVMSNASGVGSIAASPKIPFIGAGGGTTISFEKEVQDMSLVSGSSNYFTVRKGEKIADLNKICREIFDAANKASVDDTIKTLIQKKFIMDERVGFERVMQASAGGPNKLITDVNGIEFNVDEVTKKVKDGGKNITGGLKDLGSNIKDSIGGIFLAETSLSAAPAAKKNLCYDIQMDIKNNILSEKYTDCAGGSIDEKDDVYRRAIQVAQEIAMSAGQRLFTAKDFPGVSLNLSGEDGF